MALKFDLVKGLKSCLLVMFLILTKGLFVSTTPTDYTVSSDWSKVNEVACRSSSQPARLTGDRELFLSIRSPDYPNNYPNNSHCLWLITAPIGYVVLLEALFINIETYGCRWDRLQLYDGNTASPHSRTMKICDTYNQSIYTNTSDMLVEFISDSYITRPGFHLQYKAVPRSAVPPFSDSWIPGITTAPMCSQYNGPKDLSAFPNEHSKMSFPLGGTPYYSNSMCDWSIKAWPGYIVLILLTSLEIEYSPNCTNDGLEIFDGDSFSDPVLIKICNRIIDPISLASTGMYARIRFISDRSVNGKGFSISFMSMLNPVDDSSDDYSDKVIGGLAATVGLLFIALIALIKYSDHVIKRKNSKIHQIQQQYAASSRTVEDSPVTFTAQEIHTITLTAQ